MDQTRTKTIKTGKERMGIKVSTKTIQRILKMPMSWQVEVLEESQTLRYEHKKGTIRRI